MVEIKIYEKTWCPFCRRAKEYFEGQRISAEYINVEQTSDEHEKLKEKYNYHTVPMIFINGKMIGGYSELMQLEGSGELKKLLSDGDK